MKVSELIEILKTMPQEAQLKYVWDGGARGCFDYVYLSNDGDVLAVGHGDYVSSNGECPLGKSVDTNMGLHGMFWFDCSNGY